MFALAINLSAVDLAWDASAGATSYTLYWGPASRSYLHTATTINTSNRVVFLSPGAIVYFAATASANGFESGFSDEISYSVPLDAPYVYRVDILSAPTVNGPWTIVTGTIVSNSNSSAYYRAAITPLNGP